MLVVVASRPVLQTIYDRLLFKSQYPKMHFEEIVEGRSGAIGVTPNGAVFGGGIYDGPGPDNVTLTATPVQNNRPDNCEPPGSITS